MRHFVLAAALLALAQSSCFAVPEKAGKITAAKTTTQPAADSTLLQQNSAQPLPGSVNVPPPTATAAGASTQSGAGATVTAPPTLAPVKESTAQLSPQPEAAPQQGTNILGLVGLGLSLIALLAAGAALWFSMALRGQVDEVTAKLEAIGKQIRDFDKKLAAVTLQPSELQRKFNTTVTRPPAGAVLDMKPAATPTRAVPQAAPMVSVGRPQENADAGIAPAAIARPADMQTITNELLRCIEVLALAGQQITEANAVVRIINAVKDSGVKDWLQRRNFSVSFFTAAGDASAINAELLAWNIDGGGLLYVVPHPQAGRVGQFNKWFDFRTADYATQPVLAATPARARLDQGRLIPADMGTLR